jgi:hypothetical protein
VVLGRAALVLVVLASPALSLYGRAADGVAHVVDLDGRVVDPLKTSAAARGTVVVFVRTDCPIANRLLPAIERLRAAYEPKGVTFWLVFVDPSEPVAAIRKHLLSFDQHSNAVRDSRHELVKLTGATRTPEAAVYVPDGPRVRLVYRGRIDNKFVDVGRARPAATSHDLQDILDVVLSGRTTATPRITQPVGCIIADLE